MHCTCTVLTTTPRAVVVVSEPGFTQLKEKLLFLGKWANAVSKSSRCYVQIFLSQSSCPCGLLTLVCDFILALCTVV